VNQRWKVLTFRGIPLYLSASWLFFAVLVVYSQFLVITQSSFGVSNGEATVLALVTAALFFGSVLVHEAAHAVMARGLDLPVSGITLVFWGGATETRANAKGPLAEFLVALVGPATTLVLAGVFYVASLGIHGLAAEQVRWLAWLSLLFAGLNALPGFPLDGGRMLVAAVWGLTKERRTGLRVAGVVGRGLGIVLGAGAVWSFTNRSGWWLFLGYLAFILIASGSGVERRVALMNQLARGTVAEAMRAAPPVVTADQALTQALDQILRGNPEEAFPVLGVDGTVLGTVSLASARRVGARDPMRPVRDAVTPLNQTVNVRSDESLADAAEWIAGREALVVDDGRLVGAIGPADVERWYRRVVEGRHEEAPVGAPGPTPPRPDLQ
jgi:Zn-dependent protease/CBS domain-containing protein